MIWFNSPTIPIVPFNLADIQKELKSRLVNSMSHHPFSQLMTIIQPSIISDSLPL